MQCRGNEKFIQNIGHETSRGKNRMGDIDVLVYGKIILKWTASVV
jgi:hypothetical protein